MQDTVVTLLVLAVYVTVVFSFGLWMARGSQSRSRFFLAKRQLSGGLVGATLSATVVGGSATIAAGALVYSIGLPGLWLDVGGIVGLLVLGFFVSSRVRKTSLFTLPEIVGKMYGPFVRKVSAVLVVVSQIAWVSLLLQACSAVISSVLPVDSLVVLGVLLVIFVSYTLIGGQLSVVWTDVIQLVVMVVGVCCIATPLIVMQAWGGFSSISIDLISFPLNSSVSVFSAASMFLLMGLPSLVGPDVYSKILSARNERAASQGCFVAAAFRALFAVCIGLLGLSAVVLVPGLQNPSLAIPSVILLLPSVLSGVVLAAFLSVMLSSADSVLLSAGTVVSVDLVGDKKVWTSRIAMVGVAVFGFVVAVLLNDVIATLKLAYTVFVGGLTLPVLFGLYAEKTHVSSSGALYSFVLGGSASLIWFFLGSPYIDAVLFGLMCSLVPLVVLKKRKNGLRDR